MSNARNIASGAKFVDTVGGDSMINDGEVLKLSRTSGQSENLILSTQAAAGVSGTTYVGQLESLGNNALEIFSTQNIPIHIGTNNAVRMTVDGSGIVTKPYQPCFGARGYSGTTTQIGGYNPMLWVNVHTNVGNNFNNSTGKFTFPVSGRYYVECNINLKNTDASWLGLYFLYNTSVQANSWSMNQSNTQYNDTIVSGVVDASANDYCAFCWHNSYIAPAGSSYFNYNYANIFFIG